MNKLKFKTVSITKFEALPMTVTYYFFDIRINDLKNIS